MKETIQTSGLSEKQILDLMSSPYRMDESDFEFRFRVAGKHPLRYNIEAEAKKPEATVFVLRRDETCAVYAFDVVSRESRFLFKYKKYFVRKHVYTNLIETRFIDGSMSYAFREKKTDEEFYYDMDGNELNANQLARQLPAKCYSRIIDRGEWRLTKEVSENIPIF